MPVERGLFIPQTGTSPNFQGTNPLQARLAFAGMLAENSSGSPRPGLLMPTATLVVTGTSDMSYNVAAVNVVTTRAAAAGAYVFSTTGTTNRKTTPAPGANSRYDIIWTKQNDTQYGDADNTAEIYVTQGTPAAAPVKPAPSLNGNPVQGALVLAEALVQTGATATNSSLVQISQVWRYTVPRGAPIPVRNLTELNEITPGPGVIVQRLDLGGVIEVWDAGSFSYSKGKQFSWLRAPEVKWGSTKTKIGALGSVQDINNNFCSPAGVESGFRITLPGLYNVEMFLAGNNKPGAGVATLYRDGVRYTEAGIGSTGSWCGILSTIIYVTGTSDISVDGSSATDWFMVPNFRITRLG